MSNGKDSKEIAKAIYSIFSSPFHPPQKDHLPTLIVTPAGKPQHILYIYLHTNYNLETYLLTPSDAGDLCVAKLFPPHPDSLSSGSSQGHGSGSSKAVKCEASRNLRWSIVNTGVAMPTYKLTLPNPDGGEDQPLIQISKTNKNSPFWLMTYYTYAGHLIPPNRVEFGRIEKSEVSKGGDGGTRVVITGKTEEQKAVWKTLGEGNEDMVEWCVLCGALNVIDDEVREAARAAGHPIRPPPNISSSREARDPASKSQARDLHPTGRTQGAALSGLSVSSPSGDGTGSMLPPRIDRQKSGVSSEGRAGPPLQPLRDRDQVSARAPSPYMQPPPSPGGSRRPPLHDARSMPPVMGDPRRPMPSPQLSAPRGEGSRSPLPEPTPRMRGNSADPRLMSSPIGFGGPQQQRDPRDVRSFGPPPRDGPPPSVHRDLRDVRSVPSFDSRGPAPSDAQSSRPPRAAPPPPGLRNPPPPLNAMRPPTTVSNAGSRPLPQQRRPSSQDRANSTGRHERTSSHDKAMSFGRHERTSSLDATRNDLRAMTMRSASPSGTSNGPDHRNRAGREPSSYQPGQRRFDKPSSPTVSSSSPSPPLSGDRGKKLVATTRGVQLQDVPASRTPPLASTEKSDPHTTVMSAAEKIKAQRLARARQASNNA